MGYLVTYSHPVSGARRSPIFGVKADALTYREAIPRDWAPTLEYTMHNPDIFPHCRTSEAIGEKCPDCGQFITRGDAARYQRINK